jgi:hypothetical protein
MYVECDVYGVHKITFDDNGVREIRNKQERCTRITLAPSTTKIIRL